MLTKNNCPSSHCTPGSCFPEASTFIIAQLVKESPCKAGDPGLIPGSGRSVGEGIGYPLHILGLPLWLSWQRTHLQCGRPGFNPWVGKIPWKRERLPQYFGLENSMVSQRLGHDRVTFTLNISDASFF